MDGGGWRWMENDLSLALIHQLVDVLGCWWMRKWWRRRESNPRPQVLRYKTYMFSIVFGSHHTLPDGQGKRVTSSGFV